MNNDSNNNEEVKSNKNSFLKNLRKFQGCKEPKQPQPEPQNSEEYEEFVISDITNNSIKEYKSIIGKFNILVVGKTGVGKSTLLNSIFREDLALTGKGEPITGRKNDIIKKFTSEGSPLSIIDTQGLEIEDYPIIISELERYINECNSKSDLLEHVHVGWLCIDEGGARIEQAEIHLINMLLKYRVPVIIVLTKCLSRIGMKDETIMVLTKELILNYSNLKLKGESIKEWTIRLIKTCKKEELDFLLKQENEDKDQENKVIILNKILELYNNGGLNLFSLDNNNKSKPINSNKLLEKIEMLYDKGIVKGLPFKNNNNDSNSTENGFIILNRICGNKDEYMVESIQVKLSDGTVRQFNDLNELVKIMVINRVIRVQAKKVVLFNNSVLPQSNLDELVELTRDVIYEGIPLKIISNENEDESGYVSYNNGSGDQESSECQFSTDTNYIAQNSNPSPKAFDQDTSQKVNSVSRIISKHESIAINNTNENKNENNIISNKDKTFDDLKKSWECLKSNVNTNYWENHANQNSDPSPKTFDKDIPQKVNSVSRIISKHESIAINNKNENKNENDIISNNGNTSDVLKKSWECLSSNVNTNYWENRANQNSDLSPKTFDKDIPQKVNSVSRIINKHESIAINNKNENKNENDIISNNGNTSDVLKKSWECLSSNVNTNYWENRANQNSDLSPKTFDKDIPQKVNSVSRIINKHESIAINNTNENKNENDIISNNGNTSDVLKKSWECLSSNVNTNYWENHANQNSDPSPKTFDKDIPQKVNSVSRIINKHESIAINNTNENINKNDIISNNDDNSDVLKKSWECLSSNVNTNYWENHAIQKPTTINTNTNVSINTTTSPTKVSQSQHLNQSDNGNKKLNKYALQKIEEVQKKYIDKLVDDKVNEEKKKLIEEQRIEKQRQIEMAILISIKNGFKLKEKAALSFIDSYENEAKISNKKKIPECCIKMLTVISGTFGLKVDSNNIKKITSAFFGKNVGEKKSSYDKFLSGAFDLFENTPIIKSLGFIKNNKISKEVSCKFIKSMGIAYVHILMECYNTNAFNSIGNSSKVNDPSIDDIIIAIDKLKKKNEKK